MLEAAGLLAYNSSYSFGSDVLMGSNSRVSDVIESPANSMSALLGSLRTTMARDDVASLVLACADADSSTVSS